jgi:hypothetical protein
MSSILRNTIVRTELVHCDRCHQKVEGHWGDVFTSGFYNVAPPSYWAKYARPYETVICDCCMWADEGYQEDYGWHPCDDDDSD